MKKADKKKLHELDISELQNRLEKSESEALAIKMQRETGKQKDLIAHRKKRKEIAVISSILREKELAINNKNNLNS